MTKVALQAARAVFNRNIESKRTVHTATDGLAIGHNNFVTLDGNMLECTQGVADPMNNSSIASRIGDEIMLKGVSIKFMVEMNEKYSDVTFRMFIVKKAKGDVCDRSTFFSGTSGNKMIDTINTERFTVLKSKTFKMTAPNNTYAYTSSSGGTFLANSTADTVYSRPTKIIKLYVPGSKFKKNGKIIYENGTSQPKFFDYVCLLFAYSNYSTLQDVGNNVGLLNDYVRTIHYKDA